MTNKQEVATTNSHFSLVAPDFLSNNKGPLAGNENVGSADISTPIIKLIQQLSPHLNSAEPNYVKEAKAGQIFVTVVNELHDTIKCVNVFYAHEWAVYQTRESGGPGFKNKFSSEAEAIAFARSEGEDTHIVKETGTHQLLLVNDEGVPTTEAVIYMDGSKFFVSKDWNKAFTGPGLHDKDRFSSVWELSTVRQTNKKGTWFNFKPTLIGFVDEELYGVAKALYEAVTPRLAS